MESAERQKSKFSQRLGGKCRLVATRIEQNHGHTWIICKGEFCSSFNEIKTKFYFSIHFNHDNSYLFVNEMNNRT